jgi:hypothetical protein
MSRHPQPPVAQVIVHEEDVAGLEGDLVRVRHLGVGEDGHHPLLVVDRLGGRHGVRQPLVLQQVGYVRVVAWGTQQRGVHSITLKADPDPDSKIMPIHADPDQQFNSKAGNLEFRVKEKLLQNLPGALSPCPTEKGYYSEFHLLIQGLGKNCL